ncbi:MAG: hypothetical protein V1859_11410 [archaeon]
MARKIMFALFLILILMYGCNKQTPTPQPTATPTPNADTESTSPEITEISPSPVVSQQSFSIKVKNLGTSKEDILSITFNMAGYMKTYFIDTLSSKISVENELMTIDNLILPICIDTGQHELKIKTTKGEAKKDFQAQKVRSVAVNSPPNIVEIRAKEGKIVQEKDTIMKNEAYTISGKNMELSSIDLYNERFELTKSIKCVYSTEEIIAITKGQSYCHYISSPNDYTRYSFFIADEVKDSQYNLIATKTIKSNDIESICHSENFIINLKSKASDEPVSLTPIIIEIIPSNGDSYTKLDIKGKNFGIEVEELFIIPSQTIESRNINEVTKYRLVYYRSSDSLMYISDSDITSVAAPFCLKNGNYDIYVKTNNGLSNSKVYKLENKEDFKLDIPVISKLSKNEGKPGTKIDLEGNNLIQVKGLFFISGDKYSQVKIPVDSYNIENDNKINNIIIPKQTSGVLFYYLVASFKPKENSYETCESGYNDEVKFTILSSTAQTGLASELI